MLVCIRPGLPLRRPPSGEAAGVTVTGTIAGGEAGGGGGAAVAGWAAGGGAAALAAATVSLSCSPRVRVMSLKTGLVQGFGDEDD